MAEKQMGASGRQWRARRRRVAAVAAVAGIGASIPMLFGAGNAAASTLVPCTYGPVGTRLEVDCTNNDFTPATVNITAWCTNFANISLQPRMAPRSRAHFTRDCGPGANPIIWFVNSESDWENIQDQLQQQEQDRENHQNDDHHHHDSKPQHNH